ncbi:MAG: hypothetical protein ACR2RV_07355 [Verrucomicrobiales bacterium]
MSTKEFNRELRKLQFELGPLQKWTRRNGLRAVVAFWGRDAAGKRAQKPLNFIMRSKRGSDFDR